MYFPEIMQLPYNKLSIKWIQFWKDDVLAEESDKVWDLCDQEVIGFCCRWTEDVWECCGLEILWCDGSPGSCWELTEGIWRCCGVETFICDDMSAYPGSCCG